MGEKNYETSYNIGQHFSDDDDDLPIMVRASSEHSHLKKGRNYFKCNLERKKGKV